MYSFSDVFGNKNRILFVFAHPDDIDAYYGGTLALLAKANIEVFAVIVTNGARGSKINDISEATLGAQRQEEQAASFNVLGLKADNLLFLNYVDGEVENNFKLIGEISHAIRKFKPDLVVTFQPQGLYFPFGEIEEHYVNHRDHRNTGLSTLDAVYPFSRDVSFFREQISNGVSSHTVKEIMFTGEIEPNVEIDITEVVDIKRLALRAHTSQLDESFIERIINVFKNNDRFVERGTLIKLAW